MTIYLSASGMGRFNCENKWTLDQLERETPEPAAEDGWEEVSSPPSDPLRLGTLWHRLTAAWRAGKSWEDEFNLALSEEPEWASSKKEPAVYPRAHLLMERYVAYYVSPPWPVIANELPFDLAIPGVSGVRVHGFLDGVYDAGTRKKPVIWCLEDKSMSRWGPEQVAHTSTQNLLYMWATKHLFADVEGLLFEAVSTYDYKDPTPDQPFRRILVPYDERANARIEDDLRRVARRAKALIKNPSLAVRSVGDPCKWCDYTVRCLEPWKLDES